MNTNSISRIAFTVCNLGYLNKALVLANSLHQTNNLKTNIFIFDDTIDLPKIGDHIIITWIKDVCEEDFLMHAFKYNVIELTTAYKSYIARKLINSYQQVLYFDPDIMFFGSLDHVYEQLNTNSFLLTPHFSTVSWKASENIHLQRFGFYNLGFFAVNKSDDSVKILDWWWQQCEEYCFDESHYGSFTDQKWMSLAPFYFNDICVLNNPELNAAWWNLKERKLTLRDNQFSVNGTPLVFFHFSAFGNENELSKRLVINENNDPEILKKLAHTYSSSLSKNTLDINTKYTYDYFEDGDYINPVLRRAYASNIKYFEEIANPFSKPKKLNQFISRNYLKSRSSENLSHIGYKDKEKHSKKLNLYSKIMRLVLRIIGPNKFMAFNRLLTYSSSMINFKEMWR